jgi:tetratricopeptide (TPR) repeat protein
VRRLLVVLALFLAACRAREERRPPIILISIDTLRADRVDAARMPHVVALGRDGIVFRNAWSQSPLTLPSHLSIFTGLLPPEHGVRDNSGFRFDPRAHPTMAEQLRRNGYATGAAVSAYVLRASTGASAGFTDYDDAIGLVDGAPTGALQRPGDVTEPIAERWIAAHDTQPFFYFLHLYEPHTPYAPTYDADVTHADAIVGRFLTFLKQHHDYDRAMIVLVSDHGEGLMDHGEQEHGVLLYREALQVPLIVKSPSATARGVDDTPTPLVDVLPKILDAAHIEHAPPAHTIYSESFYARIHLGCSEMRSLVDRNLHVIDRPNPEVFDLTDRAETTNVIGRERRAATAAFVTLARIGGAFAKPEAIDPEEAKKLADLGYVSAGTDAGAPARDPSRCLDDVTKLKAIAELRRQGRNGDAIARMEALLAENPHWSDVRDQLAAAYADAGDPLRAAQTYEDGIRVSPQLAGTFALSAASSLLDAGRLDDAAAHAKLALATGTDGAHLLLGEIALARGDIQTAAREEALAMRASGGRAHALFLGARIAAAGHDYARAAALLRDVDRARQQTGESLPRGFHYLAGDTLAHLGHAADAEREMEQAIAAEPHDLQPFADLALLHLMRADRAGAFATLERMLAANPRDETRRFAEESLNRWGERAEAAKWHVRRVGQ